MPTTTPEQFIQGLRQRGVRVTLETTEPEATFRLTGPREAITIRIREYIRRHREELAALFGQARCVECYRLVDEHDESAWHITDEGDLYCIECWQQLTKPAPDPQDGGAAAFLALVRDVCAPFGPFTPEQIRLERKNKDETHAA
jgi:hypothetical protein